MGIRRRSSAALTLSLLALPLAASARPPDPPVTAPLAGIDYLVVTDTALAPAFAPLVAEKASRGLTAEVRTLDQIFRAFPPGRDDAETIRAYLRMRHARDGLRYVLLGGDSEIVPVRMMQRDVLPPFDDPVACDAYYAGLDGSWDDDGDDVFGEWADDVSDLVPELAIGRAPVRTLPEAETFVAKTLAFAATRDSAFRDGILFLSELESLDYAAYSEDMIGVLAGSSAALDIVRRYENSAAWPGSLPLSRQTALAELRSGDHAFAFHLGVAVCDQISMGDSLLTAADLDSLGNATPFVFCSLGTTSPLVGDCAVETLLRDPAGGAVAALGGSGIAFTAPLLQLTTGILQEVYVGSTREIGEATRRAIAGVGPSYDRYLTAWTLLGDPELDIGPQDVAPTSKGRVATAGSTPRIGPAAPHPSPHGAGIRFELPRAGDVRLAVHDVRGRLVWTKELGPLPAGSHRTDWDGRDRGGAPVAAGIYFVRVVSAGVAATGKLVLLD